MKKILIIFLLIIFTNVNASRIYLFKSYSNEYITNNDNYNYNDYILEQNQILIVPPENGIIANDIINTTDYKIVILEDSKNSNLNDIELNETTGGFTYTPSNNVVGEVSFKYYVEYDKNKTNESYIYFYVRNTPTKYTINYYENTNKILPSITKISNVNHKVTESAIAVDGYNIISNKSITKQMSNKENENNFNFYYEKIPNTGI